VAAAAADGGHEQPTTALLCRGYAAAVTAAQQSPAMCNGRMHGALLYGAVWTSEARLDVCGSKLRSQVPHHAL
jgi:hypothetical protein